MSLLYSLKPSAGAITVAYGVPNNNTATLSLNVVNTDAETTDTVSVYLFDTQDVEVNSLTITNPGAGYVGVPAASMTDAPAGLVLTTHVEVDQVDLDPSNVGLGYSINDVVTLPISADTNATLTVTGVDTNGEILTFDVTTRGDIETLTVATPASTYTSGTGGGATTPAKFKTTLRVKSVVPSGTTEGIPADSTLSFTGALHTTEAEAVGVFSVNHNDAKLIESGLLLAAKSSPLLREGLFLSGRQGIAVKSTNGTSAVNGWGIVQPVV